MSEVRLVPSALLAWAVLLVSPVAALLVIAVSAAVAWGVRQRGQAILISGVGLSVGIAGQSPPGSWGPVSPVVHWWSEQAAVITARFSTAVANTVGPSSRGLLPGMVLGDVSLQSPGEREMYIATGLSHLSAVSGANISVVTTAVFIGLRVVGVGPRAQVGGALLAMLAFVALVGPEPSVLRASVTGLVGLAAVVASARMQPVHALSLGVIVLLLVDPGLARDFGFALSVAATGGIIGIYPYLYRVLAPLRLPDIVARAVAVAIAADTATMPLIALMSGRVSLVSVWANVLVAPASVPVTVLGLLAVPLAQVGLAAPVLRLIEPCTWWIFHVAQEVSSWPLHTVVASPLLVALVYGWILFWLKYPRATIPVLLAGLLALSYQPGRERQLENVVAVESVDFAVDRPGVDAYVVTSPGPPNARPVRTPGGIPVLFPARDGPVVVLDNGTQRGHFSAR